MNNHTLSIVLINNVYYIIHFVTNVHSISYNNHKPINSTTMVIEIITKKEFKERCSVHVYGKGQRKVNAIYFDWKHNQEGIGFKYVVKANVLNCKLNELYKHLYDWVFNEVQLPYYIQYRYAETDAKRFKVKLTERV